MAEVVCPEPGEDQHCVGNRGETWDHLHGEVRNFAGCRAVDEASLESKRICIVRTISCNGAARLARGVVDRQNGFLLVKWTRLSWYNGGYSECIDPAKPSRKSSQPPP